MSRVRLLGGGLCLCIFLTACQESPAVREKRKPREEFKEKIIVFEVHGDDGSERLPDAKRKAQDWLRKNPEYRLVEGPWTEDDAFKYKILVRPKTSDSQLKGQD